MARNFLKDTYGLKNLNAFHARSAIEEDLELWINREKEVASIERILKNSITNPKHNVMVMIVGDYGMGKTLTLLKVREMSKPKNAYPIYINLKPEEKVRNPGLDLLQRIFINIDFDNINVKKGDIDKLTRTYKDVGKLFENIFCSKKVNSESLIEDKKRLSIAFLQGESLTQKQRFDLGIVSKMDKIEKATKYLIGILYLLKKSGYPSLVLAIDEFEYLFSTATKAEQQYYLASLRQLYDIRVNIPSGIINDVANMALFIATSDDGKRRFEELKEISRIGGGPTVPFSQRISYTINLENLVKKSVLELIEKRLKYNRASGNYEKKPLIPYTEDFVNYIYGITKGVPRDVIEGCDSVLEHGLELEIPKLDAEFAKKVFEG